MFCGLGRSKCYERHMEIQAKALHTQRREYRGSYSDICLGTAQWNRNPISNNPFLQHRGFLLPTVFTYHLYILSVLACLITVSHGPHPALHYAYRAKTSLIISNVLFSSTSKSCSPVSHILNCTYSRQRASLSATSTP